MLRSLIALAATLFLTTIAAAQEAAPDVAELKRLLAWFLDGASRNDVAVHERFWAEELVYTRSAGVRTNKAEILADVRKGADPAEPPTAYSAEDVSVQQYGDIAIVAFRLVGKAGGDSPETLNFLNTGTFLKRNGEWRAIAWQATRMALAPAQDAPVNLTPGATARPGLAEEIRQADAEFFRAFFDTCDIDTVRRYIADDFEMIHDKGGIVATSGAQLVEETVDKCKRQAEGTDFLSTRKLVPDTLKVYPIQQDGAIATGSHTFYAVKAGEPDRLTETGQFTTFWKQVDGQWKMMRALSYDHVLAK
ncbi:MAG TPA: nuclear transport factor 2 family protein [Steroidobacteraceae bacterium]|jgi:ketosteroid isomerase-like protein|nr:nuclear transport factor 2 family protein [Steroidobacteraceae bacterium]